MYEVIKIEAIYDINCNIVGWASNYDIFDIDLNWIAFISDCYIFDSKSMNWLGGYIDGSITDKNGKALAWVDGNLPISTLRLHEPQKPAKPVEPCQPRKPRIPLKPMKPATPLVGWSVMSWNEWINQR